MNSSIAVYLIPLLALFFLIETILEKRAQRNQTTREDKARLYYPWSYHTRSGVRFATWRGSLKLELAPGTLYKNKPNQKSINFTINSHGFRGKEIEPDQQKANGPARRIALTGGSTAFGTGATSDTETIAHHLEEKLNIDVINASVIGYRSGQELAAIANELVEFKPELFVSLSGWNDFSQYWLSPTINGAERDYGFCAFELIDDAVAEAQRLLGEPLYRRLARLPRWLLPQLVRQLDRQLGRQLHRLKSRSHAKSDRERLAGHEKKIPVLAKVYARNMQSAAAIAKANGAQFLCLLQPVGIGRSVNEQSLLPHYDQFRVLVKRALTLRSVSFIDLNDPDNRLSADLFRDLTHPTAVGQFWLAQKIAYYIDPLLSSRTGVSQRKNSYAERTY